MRSIQFFLLACCALLLGLPRPAQAQRAVWQQSQLNSSCGVGSQIIDTDSAGNTYISAAFTDSLRLPGTTVNVSTPASIYPDVYVAKYDPAGHLLWVQAAGGADFEQPYGMVVDHRAGIIYTTGQAGKGFRMGTMVLDSGGVYLARLSAATGAVQWARRVGPIPTRPTAFSKSMTVNGLAVAADHSLYVGGMCIGVDSLDSLPLVNGHLQSNNGFVARCTPAGVFTEVFELRGGWSSVTGVDISPSGDLAVRGLFTGSVQFGPAAGAPILNAVTTFQAGGDAFLLRLAPSGTVQWVKQVSTPDYLVQLMSVAFDAQDNWYSTGASTSQVTVDQTLAADSGQHVFKLDPQGNLVWLKTFPDNERQNYAKSLLIAPDGLLYSTGVFFNIRATGPATYGTFQLPPFGITNLFVLCQDPATGDVRWAKTRDQVSGTGSNNIGYTIKADAQSNLFVLGWNDAPGTYDGNEVGSYATFLLRLEPSAFLSGQVYLDANGNGVRDAGDSLFPRSVMVREQQRAEVYGTNATGSFNAFVDPGPFSLSLAAVPAYYAVSAPASGVHQGNLTGNGQRIVGQDFGLRPIAGQQDLRVTLTPYSRARPGQVLRYRARVENVGTTTIASGQVSVTLDAAATLIGSVPVANQVQQQTLSWTFANLAPFGIRDYDVTFSLPVTIPLNTPVLSSAAVTPVSGDVVPADNVDELRQLVNNSSDPNQITVNYEQLTPQQVAAGQPLDYIIEFENLGNDTAYAVTIQDTLPANLLQLGTLRMVSQSHHCEAIIVGRMLKVKFPNIVLPHQAIDAIRSKGFVRFRVTPNSSLGLGTLIPNTAHITFDFNLPVSTNQATTLVQQATGLPHEPNRAALTVSPNPATEQVMLAATLPAAGRVALQVLDALGRDIQQHSWLAPAGELRHQLQVARFGPGVYFVRLTLPNGASTSQKLVVVTGQ